MILRIGVFGVVVILALAGCGSAAPPTSSGVALPQGGAKLLATVALTATPGLEEQRATAQAAQPSQAAATATLTPQATAYVGIFLGESGADDSLALAANNPPTPDQRPPVVASCPLPADNRFGENWRSAPNAAETIGCPADRFIPYDGVVQVFERGVMYFTPDGEIWALSPQGGGEGKFWYAAQPPVASDENIAPPDGLRVPTLGFGQMWRGTPGLRDALGFARTEEQQITFGVQLFQNGALLVDNNAASVFVMVGAGTEGAAYGPY